MFFKTWESYKFLLQFQFSLKWNLFFKFACQVQGKYMNLLMYLELVALVIHKMSPGLHWHVLLGFLSFVHFIYLFSLFFLSVWTTAVLRQGGAYLCTKTHELTLPFRRERDRWIERARKRDTQRKVSYGDVNNARLHLPFKHSICVWHRERSNVWNQSNEYVTARKTNKEILRWVCIKVD